MEGARRDERCKRSGHVAGLFGGEGKLRADGFVGGILDEGDGGVGRGFVPAVLLGDQFAQFISDDLRSWQLIAKQANISLDD